MHATPSLHAPSAEDVVTRFYEDFDRGRLAGSEAVGPDFVASVFGTTVLDRPGFLAFAQSFVDAFPDGRHEFELVIAEGEEVATVGHYRGRHEGELMGVPATGREVSFPVMHVDRVRDGRIVEHRGTADVEALWAQLGIDPPAG